MIQIVLLRFVACATLLFSFTSIAQSRPRVLVYTRNYTPDGKGYVHDNIAASVAAIRRMGAEKSFDVDVSDDPNVFTDQTLKRYAGLIFSNSNNEAFATEGQRNAFQHYIRAGHGFVGIHSASGSERNWNYFQQVLGGHFAFHPAQQSFTVTMADPSFPAVANMPRQFEWKDECYFTDRLGSDIKPVLTTDRTQLQLGNKADDAKQFPNPLPLAWYHTFDNSREFYVAVGHNSADYENMTLYHLIEGGILWSINLK